MLLTHDEPFQYCPDEQEVLELLGDVDDGVGAVGGGIWQVVPFHVPPYLAQLVAGSGEPDGGAAHELPFQNWPDGQEGDEEV